MSARVETIGRAGRRAPAGEDAFDASVRDRVESVWRLTQVIRHDLNNLLYPNEKLMRVLESRRGDREAQRHARQARSLVAMIEENRRALGRLADSRSDGGSNATTDIASWWRDVQRLLASLMRNAPPVPLREHDPPTPPAGAPDGDLTRLFAALLVGIDQQLPDGAERAASLEARSADGALRLRLTAAWSGEGAPRAPAMAREIASSFGGRVECSVANGEAIFDVFAPHLS